MDTPHLAHSMAMLSKASKAPASVKRTAESLSQRLRNKLEVFLISLDPDLIQKVLGHPFTPRLEPILDFRPHIATSPPTTPDHCLIIQLISETADLIIDTIDGHHAIWSPNIDIITPNKVAFRSKADEPDDLLTWVKSFVQSGQEADIATAQFLERKFDRLIGTAKIVQTSPTEPSCPLDVPNVVDSDIKSILNWCVRAIEDIRCNWPETASEAATLDLWAAHDQLVLLELEETSAAAKTALCIILQLRLEIERTTGDSPARHLPNLKLAKAC